LLSDVGWDRATNIDFASLRQVSFTAPDGDAEPHLASDLYRDFPGVIWRVFAAGRSSTPVRHRVVK